MFKIYFVNSAYEKDQVLMYDDTRDDDELKLGNPKLHIEVNAAGTLDFELPSTNVAYSRIIPMVTELHVIKDNQKTHNKHIWFGRVLTIDTDLYGTKTCHCEGGLAYLNDCIYYDKSVDVGSWSNPRTVGRALFARYKSPTLNDGGFRVYGVSPQEASAVIANIMSGGSNYKENLKAPFKHLGRIAKYVDPKDNVSVYAWVNEPVVPSGDQNDDDYYFDESNLDSTVQKQCGITNPNNLTAVDLISSMMNNVGGLFWVSKTPYYPKSTLGDADLGDAVYVMQLHMRRYYPAFNPEEGQTIRLGENLTDLTITDDGTTFFTAVHPHGQHIDSGEDFTLRRGGVLTGTTYINKRTWKIDPDHGVMYCPELVEQYGMIIRDLDVGATNMYEQLVGLSISEIDNIPLISKTVGGSWTTGLRELTVKGIDLSLYNVDYSSIELTDAVRLLAPRHEIDTYLNVTAIDYDLQNVENTVFTLNAIKSSNEITSASPSYGSSSGPSSSSSAYVHPKHTEHDLGLYKFSNNNLGHVDSAVAVSKKDITALGIPDKDTKYYVNSSRNPDVHGVTLTDSQNKTTVAPLETYRRTLPLKSYSDDGEYVEGRGYLIYTTGFQIKSEYGRFDATHPLNLEGRYTLTEDQIDHKWNINGDITANGSTVILNLKTDAADSDLSLNVYAYGYFEAATDGHEYILYHVWLAVYISKDLTGLSYTTAVLSSIQYTDMEGLYLQSPPDSDHAIDYSKLVKQTENDSDENTKYELSKTGNTITLTGSDGTSSSVLDSDTTYELSLPTYTNQKEPPVPMLSMNGSDGSRNEQAIPYAYTVLKDIVYEEFSGYEFGGNYRSIADLAYVIPYSKPTEIDPCILTADLFLETKMSNGNLSDSAYCFEHTESGSTIRRMRDNAEAYSGDFAETKDWAVLDDEMMLSNPKRLVQIIRIGVANEVFNRLTGSYCSRSRLMYHVSRDGSIVRPISYYSDISIDASSQAKSHSVYSLTKTDVKNVAFTGDYNDLSNKPAIPDISGKQDKSTAVTHTTNTAVGSATKPIYVAANGAATAISHSINADVPANAKFTDTTYSDATQSAHGLMTAADKKKLDGMDLSKYLPLAGGVMSGNIDMATNKKDILVGAHRSAGSVFPTAVAGGTIDEQLSIQTDLPNRKSIIGSWLDENRVWHNILSVRHRNGWNDGPNYGFYLRSLLTSNSSLYWNKQTGADKWQGERELLDSMNYTSYAAKSDHTHAMIVNSRVIVNGANANPMWVRLGTLVSSGDFYSASIRVWTGSGASGNASQNSSFEIQIKDGWQATQSAVKACGVTVYRINCSKIKVKVIPTTHNTYVVWVYMPWGYWNGNFEVRGKYSSWTPQVLRQPDEPEGTGADTAYFDQAFLTSTVEKSTKATALTDSGWSNVTTYIADTTDFSNITASFRRMGQIALVKCSFTPLIAMTSITVCDVTKLDPFIDVTPAEVVYGVGSNNNGTESFIASISYSPGHNLYLKGSFKASTVYRLMFSYPVT